VNSRVVATITECEACFTPDVCQLRGTCDHYSAEWLRVAKGVPVPVNTPKLPEPRCGYCRDSEETGTETKGYDYSAWTPADFERGWRFDEPTNTKIYHCMLAFYGAQ